MSEVIGQALIEAASNYLISFLARLLLRIFGL